MAKGINKASAVPPHLAICLPDTPAGPQIPPPEPGSYEYDLISSLELETGGAGYPFLEGLGRHWTIVQQDLDKLDEEIHPLHTFGMREPTLQIARDNAVVKIYIDGMTTEDYLEATGLRLHPEVKGQYVMGKRLSRIMRPHFISGEFDPNNVRVAYLDSADYTTLTKADPELGEKVWDGAGLVSRQMLEKMTIPEDTSPAKARRLRRELATASRVEFTIMTERGQDKGHAMIADSIMHDGREVDFLLPQDTKGEIRLESGQTWVGFDFIHGRDRMRIDIQSAINLHPFFGHEQYAEWLDDAGAVFTRAVESGDVVAAMARIDRDETLEQVESYGTRLFFASGGHPMHFQHHANSLMNQRLEQLEHKAMHKHRIEIPGGRYYVMSQSVGSASGYEGMDIPRGEVRIDHGRGTAWVNDEDWLSLQDSPTGDGIAGILGGADHDDGLWMHVFDDHDGQQKVLVWRSPNQLGEYVVLKPTANSNLPQWETADGELITSVPGDSRNLPARIDHRQVEYSQRVDHEGAAVYTIGEAITRAQANAGSLGMMCNTLMVAKAVHGDLPQGMPAPLEDIIDAQVKTGADTAHIKQWNYDYIRQLLQSGTPVPRLLIGDKDKGIKGRLSIDYGDRDNIPPHPIPASGHWLDHTVAAVREHMAHIETERERLKREAMPPRPVFDSIFDDKDAISLGSRFNSLYAAALETGDYDAARERCETFLNRFPEEEQRRILRGAIFSSYTGDKDRAGKRPSDAAVWQKGQINPATGQRERGIEHKTIEALREIGVLDEIGETSEGLIAYPGAVIEEPSLKTVGMRGVWFNYHNFERQNKGQPPIEKMRDIPKYDRGKLKEYVEEQTRSTFRDKILRVDHDAKGRLVAYTEHGNLFGRLEQGDEELQPGDRIQIHHMRAKDGNLRTTYSKLPEDRPQGE